MKKTLFGGVALALILTACNAKTETSDVDTLVVDTVRVDTVIVDTLVDTVTVDSVVK